MRVFLNQSGQTLIETMAALVILVTGVSAAVGLAVYALSSSTNVVRQIVATGLAREGIEAVRNMRDTNWLKGTLSVDGCYNFETAEDNKEDCYLNWLDLVYCINPTSNNGNCNGNAGAGQPINYYLGFDSSDPNFWVIQKDVNNELKYGLDFDPDSGDEGFYTPGSGVTCANAAGRADYCRKITLTKIASPPYDHDGDAGVLLFVQAQVWWVDKKCPRVSDFNLAASVCRIELDTYLTNWKNF